MALHCFHVDSMQCVEAAHLVTVYICHAAVGMIYNVHLQAIQAAHDSGVGDLTIEYTDDSVVTMCQGRVAFLSAAISAAYNSRVSNAWLAIVRALTKKIKCSRCIPLKLVLIVWHNLHN